MAERRHGSSAGTDVVARNEQGIPRHGIRGVATKLRRRDARAGFGFTLPAAVLMLLLVAYPLVYGIYISFFDTNLVNRWDFVGVAQYERALESVAFRASLLTTLVYAVMVVVGTHIVGMALALALNRRGVVVSVFRVILILPWLFPEVVVALLWRWIFNPIYGVLNHMLSSVGLIDQPVLWLEDSTFALFSVVFASIWKGYPLVMVLLLAGLQAIPGELYEAAAIDGAGKIKSFLHITLPGLAPVLVVTVILETVWWFKHFTIVWLMTGGGPVAATSVVSISIYREAFQNFNFGLAAAYAAIVFVICLAASWFYRMVIRDER